MWDCSACIASIRVSFLNRKHHILVARKLLQRAEFGKKKVVYGICFLSIQYVIGSWSHFSHSGFYSQCPHSKPILLYMQCWWQLLMIFLIVYSRCTFASQQSPQRKHNQTQCQWQINCLKWKSAGVYVAKQENMMRWRKTLWHCYASLGCAAHTGILIPMTIYIIFIWFFFLSTEVKLSNHEENILDVDLINVILYNTFT